MKRYCSCPIWAYLSPILLIGSFYVGYLVFIAFVPLLFLLDRYPIKISIITFFPFSLFLFYGVFKALYMYYGLNIVLSFILFAFICIYYIIYDILPSLLYKFLRVKIFFFPFLFVSFEYLRNELFGGLPIGNINNLIYSIHPFIKSASIFGAYFISLNILFVNVGIFMLLKKRWIISFLYIGFVFIFLFIPNNKIGSVLFKRNISLIQGNIPQSVKWKTGYLRKNLLKYIDLTDNLKTNIVIWPESAYPYIFSTQYNSLKRLVDTKLFDLITGAITEKDNRYFNSAVAITKQGYEFYNKQKLVPFGEYIPLKGILSYFLPKDMNLPDFSSGKMNKILYVNGVKFGPMICYEESFPYISRKYKTKGANALLIISNDAWFNRTPLLNFLARDAIYRAIENDIWVFRVANTGITEIIMPTGYIYAHIEPYKSTILTGTIKFYKTQRTIFDKFGYLFGFFITVGTFFAIIIREIFYKRDKYLS